MSTQAAHENGQVEHQRGPNTVTKVYRVRAKMDLVAKACAKAKTEGLGFNALIDKLLREYVERP
jgi:predicted HicB family RNase H-like nuclease